MAHEIEHGARRRRNRWSLAIWGGAAALLALPAIAMRFTSEVDWGPEDFVVMGALLAMACGGYEVATRLSGNTAYRAGAAIAILTCFLTVWVNLAVGMIGDEGNPANLLFGGVILIAVVGAILARFRPRGVARAMQAAAAAQGAMAVYALFAGDYVAALPIAFFMVPWLLGAYLFLKAAEQGSAVTARLAGRLAGWTFGTLLLVIGVLNLLLVYPVPAVAYGLVSLLYFPPVGDVLKARFGFSIHPAVKIVLGIAVAMFTLGVSDLGDMID